MYLGNKTFWYSRGTYKTRKMIPVVDFSAYNITVQECDIADKELSQLADKICDAFKTVGFVYIKNHGIPQAQVMKYAKITKI